MATRKKALRAASPNEVIKTDLPQTVSDEFIEVLRRAGVSQDVLTAVEERNRRVRKAAAERHS